MGYYPSTWGKLSRQPQNIVKQKVTLNFLFKGYWWYWTERDWVDKLYKIPYLELKLEILNKNYHRLIFEGTSFLPDSIFSIWYYRRSVAYSGLSNIFSQFHNHSFTILQKVPGCFRVRNLCLRIDILSQST